MHSLVERIANQDVRALARGITMIENDSPEKLEMLRDVFSLERHAHYIGITGSPGAGKSSLVNRLISMIRAEGKTVAVIAVDPTSPFSGGSLLGDRVRMNEHFTDDGVFIRSMATRGSLGGLARATKDSLRLCDAYGFDVVIVETVGVGQSELDIMKVVDTITVVLTPNSGDVLQVFKAGIMEIADLFVINKADLPGFGKLKALVKELVMMGGARNSGSSGSPRRGEASTATGSRSHSTEGFNSDSEGASENSQPGHGSSSDAAEAHETPIIKTITTENKGINKLWEHLKEHHDFLYRSNEGVQRRKNQKELEVHELIQDEIWRDVKEFIDDADMAEIDANSDPYQLAIDWYAKWKQEGGNRSDRNKS